MTQICRVHRARPPTLRVRAIRYHHRGSRPQTLLTSLLGSRRLSGRRGRRPLPRRWELELGFDEVKTRTLEREEALRSKTPARITQEVWGLALGYNLVRLAMARVAARARVPPVRISFRHALQFIRLSGSPPGPRARASCRAGSKRCTTNSPCSSCPSAVHNAAIRALSRLK